MNIAKINIMSFTRPNRVLLFYVWNTHVESLQKKHLHFWYARLTQNSWHIKKGGECNHLHTWRCDWQLRLDIRAESAVELFTETDIKDWRIAQCAALWQRLIQPSPSNSALLSRRHIEREDNEQAQP